MKNQLWLFILTILLLVSVALNVSATETRVFSMGQTGVFLYDNSNIVLFPGRVMSYGNEIVTELRLKDTESQFSAEFRLPFNAYMFGVNFNRPISVTNPGVGLNIRLDQTSDLYFGTKLAGNDLGIRLSYGRDGFNQDSTAFQPKIEESARYLEIAGGYTTDQYDASISFELPSISSEVTGNKDEFSGNIINLKGRYFYTYDARIRLVPVVMFGFGSASRKTDVGAGLPRAETKYSLLSFSLGIGANYQLSESSLLVFAIDPFGYYKIKADEQQGTETITTTTTLPRLYLGAETTIRSWLTGRIGANRAYQTVKTKETPNQGNAVESSYQTSLYNVTFGLGLKFGNFLIDLDINDGFFFEGPNLVSGRIRDFSNRVSVSYLFANPERSK